MTADILGQTWNLSQKGEEIITENNTVKDRGTILKNALNSDLKEIGKPVLHQIQNKNSISQVVLQIQKIRNISAPKSNENSQAAPRMLKLVLTDGDAHIQAIETAPISFIHLNKTPPGSKILIHSAKIASGYILLDSNNCQLLGGHVPSLFEKWELAKSVQYHNRQNCLEASGEGPPAWVNFGCKIQSDIQDKSFKSLENKNQESKENSKFDLQRQDAIAEATSGAVKKVFGGGSKQPAQAPPTGKFRKNNPPSKDKKVKNRLIGDKDGEDKPLKPSEKVSLFAFLEDKLPANEPNPPKPIVNNSFSRNFQGNQDNNRFRKTNEQYNPNRTKSDVNTKPTVQEKHEGNLEVNGLNDSFGKMTLNSQFASRSLKQHLNLGSQKKNNVGDSAWKVGDDCIAKYWEDGKFYNATITAITDKTCVVKFKGYGNIEEVLKDDCLPASHSESKKSHYTGPMEFRRTTRTFRRQ